MDVRAHVHTTEARVWVAGTSPAMTVGCGER